MLAGAVYRPLLERPPAAGLTDQLTAVLGPPATVAVNCCVWPAVSDTAVGDTATVIADSVIMALADLVGSARLVAVTVTCCPVGMLAGAVYKPPLETLPAGGVTDHVTAVLGPPAAMAVNCCVWPAVSDTAVGDIVTVIADNVTVALADLVGSARLRAVTVTCGPLAGPAG